MFRDFKLEIFLYSLADWIYAADGYAPPHLLDVEGENLFPNLSRIKEILVDTLICILNKHSHYCRRVTLS